MGSATRINITFGTPWAARQCRDWRVHEENIMDSDHRLIQMSITVDEPIHEYICNLARVNWGRFRGEVSKELVKKKNSPAGVHTGRARRVK